MNVTLMSLSRHECHIHVVCPREGGTTGADAAAPAGLLYTFVTDGPDHVTGQGVQNFFVATPGITALAGTSAPAASTPAAPANGGYGY